MPGEAAPSFGPLVPEQHGGSTQPSSGHDRWWAHGGDRDVASEDDVLRVLDAEEEEKMGGEVSGEEAVSSFRAVGAHGRILAEVGPLDDAMACSGKTGMTRPVTEKEDGSGRKQVADKAVERREEVRDVGSAAVPRWCCCFVVFVC